MPKPAPADDDRDLTRAGYLPQFRRRLGSFAAFAAGFSYLSILTGIVQNFHLGYREAGPAFFWTWPAVFAGQFCVALCFADLARRYPLCGGVYSWAGRAGSPALGWLIGWVYLASLIVTLAAVALAWQITLPVLWSGFQQLETPASNAAALGIVLIALSTFINVLGTRWLALLMTVGVVVELFAAVALVVLLAEHAVRSPAVVLEIQAGASTDGFGVAGPFLAAAVMAAYVMYGFDTAGTLAEETVDPRLRAPRHSPGVAGGRRARGPSVDCFPGECSGSRRPAPFRCGGWVAVPHRPSAGGSGGEGVRRGGGPCRVHLHAGRSGDHGPDSLCDGPRPGRAVRGPARQYSPAAPDASHCRRGRRHARCRLAPVQYELRTFDDGACLRQHRLVESGIPAYDRRSAGESIARPRIESRFVSRSLGTAGERGGGCVECPFDRQYRLAARRLYGSEWHERYGAMLYTGVLLIAGAVVYRLMRRGGAR